VIDTFISSEKISRILRKKIPRNSNFHHHQETLNKRQESKMLIIFLSILADACFIINNENSS